MGLLGHNFVSRHARRSSKGSIDAGDHLISTQILSQNLAHWIGVQGPSKLVKKPKHPTLRASPRRTPHPNKKIFLIEPRRFAASVEVLNNSLPIAAGQLQPKKLEPIYWLARSLKGFNVQCDTFAVMIAWS